MRFENCDAGSTGSGAAEPSRSRLNKKNNAVSSQLSLPFRAIFRVFSGSNGHSKKEIDENELALLWAELQQHYFPDRTDVLEYRVIWSTRPQKRTLASCNMIKKQVLVARELRDSHLRRWLSPLLYHEMCHAILAPSLTQGRRRGRRTPWHGRAFRELERRHPEIPLLDAWIRSGGWQRAIRSDRARTSWSRRKAAQ